MVEVIDSGEFARRARECLDQVAGEGGEIVVQRNGRQDRLPIDAVQRDLEVRRADVLADGEEEVVPVESHVVLRAPDLCEAGIDIDVRATRYTHERRAGRKVAADVEQQAGGCAHADQRRR